MERSRNADSGQLGRAAVISSQNERLDCRLRKRPPHCKRGRRMDPRTVRKVARQSRFYPCLALGSGELAPPATPSWKLRRRGCIFSPSLLVTSKRGELSSQDNSAGAASAEAEALRCTGEKRA